jgi:hypothetical protein
LHKTGLLIRYRAKIQNKGYLKMERKIPEASQSSRSTQEGADKNAGASYAGQSRFMDTDLTYGSGKRGSRKSDSYAAREYESRK